MIHADIPIPAHAAAAAAIVALFAGTAAAAGAPAAAAPAAAPAAAATAAPLTGEALAVKKLVEQSFPSAGVRGVVKSPYFGLYEVQSDDQLLYTDAKVNYVMVGSIYDANTKQNLTEARLRKLNRVAFDALPLDLAFKRVKGNGARKLAIFSDADCPFCAKLENELKSVDNVTIYTFLFPIDQLHPDSARKSKMIWCSPDRAKAWDEFFASGKLPDNKGDCDNPVAATNALGQKLRVSRHADAVFADGAIVPGAIPPAQLESEFNGRRPRRRQRRRQRRSPSRRRSNRCPRRRDLAERTQRWRSSISSRNSSSTSSSGRTTRATRCRSAFPTRTRKSRTARSSSCANRRSRSSSTSASSATRSARASTR